MKYMHPILLFFCGWGLSNIATKMLHGVPEHYNTNWPTTIVLIGFALSLYYRIIKRK